jgi:tetratricopeptide (TPR) repeat protein
MAQGPSNPKIEELRFRLKTDPKSRLFYPLAEELRKISQFTEAEQMLRTGLTHHPTYLSGWVSLGRVLRELGKNGEAVEALSKALQLDPGNVVAARLLADAYLALGEKVEAIKKYKLVHALLPADELIEEIIARLDAELNPPAPPPAPFVAAEPEAEPEPEPEPHAPAAEAAVSTGSLEESPFANDDDEILAAAAQTFVEEQEEAVATADAEPMALAHEESPFEEPLLASTPEVVAVEEPLGIHVEEAPLAAEVATPVIAEEDDTAADIFTPTIETPFALEEAPVAAAPPPDDLTDNVIMADLYERQGLTEKAREIYEHILQREPQNTLVRARRDSLAGVEPPPPEPESPAAPARNLKVAKLEEWLSRVARKEVSRV